MRGYVCLDWSGGDAIAGGLARSIKDAAMAHGYVEGDVAASRWVGTCGPRPPPLNRLAPDCLVIGDLYAHPDRRSMAPCPPGDQAMAGWLSRARWGRYIVLFTDPNARVRAIFRDPSGALEAFTWVCSGVRLAASSTPDWLMALASPPIRFNWALLKRVLAEPETVHGDLALRDMQAVRPGGLLNVGGAATRIWTPESFARGPAKAAGDAAADLRWTLDYCVSALAGTEAIGVELSGGLDSSIVGGALRGVRAPVRLALNSFGAGDPATDERVFARAMADRVGLSLTERARPAVAYDADAFEQTAGDPRPSQNGRDLTNDLVVAAACCEAGVDRLMTGKGGDALFFQTPTALAFADLWTTQPLHALTSSLLTGVARWTRTSAWSVLAAAVAASRSDRSGIPPAKRLQIDGILSGLAYYSACRRFETVDMVHPLMSQPLIEWALRTPVPHLVEGGRDRALARATFADRLPQAIAARRGKGDYGAYYNRQVAANLPFLRAYLLDGRLAVEGVLNRSEMETRLHPDALRWQGGAARILAAVSLEAWVRRWESRRGPS